MTARRRTLGTWGRRGDRVRALIEGGRDRVEVLYRDLDGVGRKRVFSNTKEGRVEALAWAETYHTARERERERRALGAEAIPAITMRQLWKEYTASPAWQDLRPRSQPNYTDRWRLWLRFIGDDAIAGDVRVRHIDKFITRMRALPTDKGKPRAINQIRQVLNVVRTVFNWGQSRELLSRNDFALFRWKRPKDAKVLEPEEYTPEEYAKLLAGTSPQDARTWRLNVALLLAGVHGQRAQSLSHLAWADVDGALITWVGEWMKQGDDHAQPITWDAIAALETARYWTRERTGRDFTRQSARQREARAKLAVSPWVLPGHGKPQQPWGYPAMWKSLMKLEAKVGVAHRPYRAWHGFRKMAGGNVADATGDARLAMEFLGDRDLKQAKAYLKSRDSRMERAAEAAADGVKAFPNRTLTSKTTDKEKAPTEADAITSMHIEGYESHS